MDVREKLVELLAEAKRQWEGGTNNLDGRIADHLIAHGVTVQDNTEIIDEFLKQLKNAPITTLHEEPTIEVVQEWISVKDERKPKDRRNYFIAYVFGDSNMHFFGEAKYHAYEGNGIVDRPHFSNEGVDGMRVTHWMEIPKLPQPPKGE